MVRDGGASYIRMCRVRDWVFIKAPLFLKQGCLVHSDGALCHCRRIFIGVEPGAEMCPKSQDFEAKGESCCVWRWGGRRFLGGRGGPLIKGQICPEETQSLKIIFASLMRLLIVSSQSKHTPSWRYTILRQPK